MNTTATSTIDSTQKHTPGPWRRGTRDGYVMAGTGDDAHVVAICQPKAGPASTRLQETARMLNNARLIALAPELLAFVQDYFDEADCGDGGEHEEDMSHGRCWHCTSRRLVGLLKPEPKQ